MTDQNNKQMQPGTNAMPLDKVLELAAQGWHVLPISGKDKRPPKGFIVKDDPSKGRVSQVSTDPEQIAKWHAAYPYLAFHCVKSGIAVLDVDTKHFPEDQEESDKLNAIVGVMSRASAGRVATTMSGGKHIYFNAPPGASLGSPKLFKKTGSLFHHKAEWIELKANGYIIAYDQDLSEPLQQLPAAVTRAVRVRKPKQEVRNPLSIKQSVKEDVLLDGLAKIEALKGREGARNSTVFHVARAVFRVTGPDAQAIEQLRAAALETGLPEAEVEDILERCANEQYELTHNERRYLSGGRDIEEVLISRVVYDPDTGNAMPYSRAEAVSEVWPNMLYYANKAAPQLWKRGEWLEIQGDRWVRLPETEVELRIRKLLKSEGVLLDKEMNDMATACLRTLAADCMAGTTEQIDASDHLLDRDGRVIDLRTGKITKPNPAQPLMRRLAVPYKEGATSKHFTECVRQCLAAGRNAQEAADVISWYQRICGYRLLSHKREQMLILHVGVGDNGKSTIMEAQLDYLGGELAHVMNADPMLQDYKGDPLTGFNSMIGKLMSFVEEMPEGKTLNTGVLKMLTGGRKMEVRKRYEDNKDVHNTSLIEIASNTRPRFWDNSGGWRRRLVFLQWKADFTHTKDKDMPRKLADDGEGWLQWALAGLRDYLANGEQRPQCIKASTEDYARESGDPLRKFYDTMVEASQGTETPLKTLREAYRNWLINTGVVDTDEGVKYYIRTPQDFRTKVQNLTGSVYEAKAGRVKMVRGFMLGDSDLLATPKRDRDGEYLTSEAVMELVKDA